jgi:hypothetical protein
MERAPLTLIKGGKDNEPARAEGFKRVCVGRAEIMEKKIFNKGEVLGLVEQIAKKEGIKAGELEIYREYYDLDGNLVSLDIRVNKQGCLSKGWGRIEYGYVLAGNHPECASSVNSGISRTYARKDDPDQFVAGGMVAEYLNNIWKLSPGAISHDANDVETGPGKGKK